MIPITKRRKGEEGRGWKDVLIMKDFLRHLLDIKLEITKRSGYESRTHYCVLNFTLIIGISVINCFTFLVFQGKKEWLHLTIK